MELIDLPRKYGNEEEIRALCNAISNVEHTTWMLRSGFGGVKLLKADTAARFEMVKLIDQMAEKAGRWDLITKHIPGLGKIIEELE